jgi:hypothetical protein
MFLLVLNMLYQYFSLYPSPGLAAETLGCFTSTIYSAVIPGAEDCKYDITANIAALTYSVQGLSVNVVPADAIRGSNSNLPVVIVSSTPVGFVLAYESPLVDLRRRFRDWKYEHDRDSPLLSACRNRNANSFFAMMGLSSSIRQST